MTTNEKSVSVVYKFIDGAHFFTSTDPLARGLCVASSDLRVAYDDIPRQLTTLLKSNHGIDAKVEHEKPFENFFSEIMDYVKSAMVTRKKSGQHNRHVGVTPRTSAVRLRIPCELQAA
jgi:hypothetical protein